MRIAQLSTRYPPGPGGVERHVREISTRLAVRGNSVDVFSSDLFREYPWLRLDASVPRSVAEGGLTVHRLPVWTLPGELHYPFFRGLGRALRRSRPDVLHVHTYGTNHAAVARRYARSARAPYVLTAHYHPIWSIYGGWFRHRLRAFYDQVLAAPIVADAARLIVQSGEEERLIRENGFPLPRVVRIPPGYTPLPAPPPGEHPFADAFHVPGPFILFVGRLASNKGLRPLLAAFEPLARHDPTATLVLVGEDGGERASAEAYAAELGLTNRVRFTGHVTSDALLAAAFCEARFTVLPSEYEAFGLVLLESLAQGTPVIASRVGGIPEFIEDGKSGLLVPPLEVPPLARAMEALWEDLPRRERLGEYGRTEVVPRFSWDHVVEALESVYQEVIAQ